MRNLFVAALVAVGVVTFAQSPALAGCNNGTYANGACVQKKVVGYRTVTVRKAVYRTVRTQCAAPNCAPVAVATVTVQTPPPRIVDVPQRVIVRPVPQVTYLPAPQIRVAPAPCQAPMVAPPVTRAPCGTCGSGSVAMASVYGAGAVEGASCVGQRTGKPGVWKMDTNVGQLGCWTGN